MAKTKLVLVAGGSRGVGAHIVRRLVGRGYGVRILARDPATVATADGVEVVAGDLTRPESLPPAVDGIDHIVFTAGTPSGRHAPEALVKATDHDGAIETMAAARRAGMRGRFVYLNSIGVTVPSLSGSFINLLKRNTLDWRRRVEERIRASGLDYTVIRVGFLVDQPGGRHAIRVSQAPLPLAPWHRIAREDVAEVFVAALDDPRTSRTTFDIVWGRGERRGGIGDLFAGLQRDAG
jgi:uncharacterized protein YbjT (DUF2867 family)